MANEEHLNLLEQGIEFWNEWRRQGQRRYAFEPDLSGADLSGLDLRGINLGWADLSDANLRSSDLSEARLYSANLHSSKLTNSNLSRADMQYADLSGVAFHGVTLTEADLIQANLSGSVLFGTDLAEASLRGANLSGADLTEMDLSATELDDVSLTRATLQDVNLTGANLFGLDLSEANLTGANLYRANLSQANFNKAVCRKTDLSWADLSYAHLFRTDFTDATLYRADLSGANASAADFSHANLIQATFNRTNLKGSILRGCLVHGISAWDLKLSKETDQADLIVSPRGESPVTVDDVEVAQLVYLLLDNEKVRSIIETMTSKSVLILGRFTPERKTVLETVRRKLRDLGYLPIVFDFARPSSRDLTETVSTLARLARFIVADITDPSSVPKELEAVIPYLAVPIAPLIQRSNRPYAMFKDYWKYSWVLETLRYADVRQLQDVLEDKVVAPAELKFSELERARLRAMGR